jgi:type I restriction enzyme M protein
MLDSVTKKRIDTLRQILVGKLPDPKSQVEQITNGLIYKFMNDMDEESISMGGKSTYFSGKYQKYSWKNLLDTKTSGIEKLSLYSEAIEQMYNNENLPELFREIFKNSFLPFKDPSTLNMFLKEINEFHYSNSERLGDAFEYLLSFMGSQGDAGQFRTPRHIIDFIVEIVNPQKNETILDPACGTAGFLISSYKHILNQNTKKNLGDGLTASDRKKIGDNLNGYDISPDMVKMSLVNMYLHKFTNPKINEYDTLSSEDRWNEYYDVILANPPFFSPKGGIMPHNRFGVKSTKAEVLFVDYINEHLKPKGRAGIIIPEGIIFQNNIAYSQLRKTLVEKSLIGVISLPAGVFQPYSAVKTNILILDKKLAKTKKTIFFSKVNNDGFSLSTQRNPIKENDLSNSLKNYKKYLNAEDDKFENSIDSFLLEKEKILKNTDISFNKEIYINFKKNENSEIKLVNINEFAFFQEGPGVLSSQYTQEGVPLINVRNVRDGYLDLDKTKFISKEITENKWKQFSINENDILFTTSGTIGRCAIVKKENLPLSLNTSVVRFKSLDEKKLKNKFLFWVLRSQNFKNNILKFQTGSAQQNVGPTHIKKLSIPLPPISIQNQLVVELDGYQKIIDGCRQVIENYKPLIDIDPNWEIVELGKIADIISGQSPPGSSYNKSKKGLPFYQGKTDYGDIYLLETDTYTSEVTKVSKKNDIIMSVRAPVGPVNLNPFNEICIGRGLCAIRPKNKEDLEFIFNYLQTDDVVKGHMGSTYESINRDEILKIKIPNPDKEIKNNIINIILDERKIIEGNKKIIEKFTQKVIDRINKIWSH